MEVIMIEDEDEFDAMFEDVEATAPPPEPEPETPPDLEAKAEDDAEPQEGAEPDKAVTPEPETEQQAEQTAEPEQAQAEAPPDVDNSPIPVSAFTAMREDLNSQIATLKEQLAANQRPQPQQAAQQPQIQQEEIPDPILEPEKYQAYQDNKLQDGITAALFKQNMQVAYDRELAGGKTEADLRAEAQPFMQAAQQDPSLYSGLKSTPDPIAYIRSWNAKQNAQQELAAYGGDLSAYVAAKVAEANAGGQTPTQTPAPNPAPTQQAPAVKIPQSIADVMPATEIAGVTPEQDDFYAIFS